MRTMPRYKGVCTIRLVGGEAVVMKYRHVSYVRIFGDVDVEVST